MRSLATPATPSAAAVRRCCWPSGLGWDRSAASGPSASASCPAGGRKTRHWRRRQPPPHDEENDGGSGGEALHETMMRMRSGRKVMG